jgi:hypothetical protein
MCILWIDIHTVLEVTSVLILCQLEVCVLIDFLLVLHLILVLIFGNQCQNE